MLVHWTVSLFYNEFIKKPSQKNLVLNLMQPTIYKKYRDCNITIVSVERSPLLKLPSDWCQFTKSDQTQFSLMDRLIIVLLYFPVQDSYELSEFCIWNILC